MTRILLVYDLVSEELQLYKLDVNDEELAKLHECHGQYGNTIDLPDDHPVNGWISEWLETKKDGLVFKNSMPELKPIPFDASISEVIVTGFVM